MKMTTMTIIIALVSSVQVIRILAKTRRQKTGIRSAALWIVIWLTIGFSSLFPSVMDYFMEIAQMRDRMLFILLLSVFILFALVFNLASSVEKLRKDTARVVQELSLLRYGDESRGDRHPGGDSTMD